MARTRLDAMAVHEHSGRRTWKDAAILAAALAFFLFVIAYCVVTDYDYYITDSVAFILLTLFLYVFYRRLHLDSFTFFVLVIAFVLHDLGAFRFYASPPVPFDWDVVTHVFGIFAVTVFLYNLMLSLTEKHHALLFFIVILAGLGVGVLIEFVEFVGFLTTGFGEGFLGRGFGDYDPMIVSSDYIDTIQDMLWNLVGAVIGFVAAYAKEKTFK